MENTTFSKSQGSQTLQTKNSNLLYTVIKKLYLMMTFCLVQLKIISIMIKKVLMAFLQEKN